MDTRFGAEADEDILMERLIQVENALFCLKVKASVIEGCDDVCEEERLERIRRELHESYARLYNPMPGELSGRSPGMAAASSV
jgi:hypothetical protein